MRKPRWKNPEKSAYVYVLGIPKRILKINRYGKKSDLTKQFIKRQYNEEVHLSAVAYNYDRRKRAESTRRAIRQSDKTRGRRIGKR